MNSHTEPSVPLCRPKILPDEWIETYLFRVARANGIRRPRLCDVDRFRPTLAATASSKPDGYPIWTDIPLPRWSVVTRVNKIRYCPACMVQSRYIRSRWRLTAFEVCTLHFIRLKDDLAEPVMTRGYKQPDRYFVNEVTDEQLWAGAVCPMPSERKHVDRLWSKFERLILESDLRGSVEQLTHILFLEALLDAAACTEPERESLPIDAPRSTRLAEFSERYQYSLASNSDGIRDFFEQISAPLHRARMLMRLHRMLLDEARRPTCLSSLPISDLRKRFLMVSTKTVIPQTRGDLHPYRRAPHGYVSFREAVSLIGCSSELLKELTQERFAQDVVTIERGGNRYIYIPFLTVKACRRWYASVTTCEEIMAELRISRHCYVILKNSGLLRPIAIKGRTPYFHRIHLADLCRRLDNISQPFSIDRSPLLPLFGTWLPCSGRYISASLVMLKEVFDGKFPIFRRLENPGLSAYFIDSTAIERLHQLKMTAAAERVKLGWAPEQLSLLSE
ncbi:TniQ family protein [Burkholderia ubonensis]|uniref:TniQ family protein n=1 Tax=Burkholderia ubonensis TaxID=101571 RepID=UPI000AEDCF52|nr:TniQ family protein [Burkholderia ubonensis]